MSPLLTRSGGGRFRQTGVQVSASFSDRLELRVENGFFEVRVMRTGSIVLGTGGGGL